MSNFKKMKSKIVLIFVLSFSFAFAETGAKVGFSFLKIGVDARAAAMGDAFSSLSQNASATYWNPAGLSLSESNSLVLMHNNWLQDITHEFAAIQLLQGKHNIALSLNFLNVSGIEIRGNRASELPDGKTSANFVAIGLGYANTIMENWNAGIHIKYLYEKYYLRSANGFAFDFGIMRKNLVAGVNWGMSIQNIGKMGKLENESTPLPLLIRSGISYNIPLSFLQNGLLTSVDLMYVFEDVFRVNMGVEGRVFNGLDLRAGYIAGSESYDFTAGFGIVFGKYNLSYAFVPFSYDLGSSHRFSVLFKF